MTRRGLRAAQGRILHASDGDVAALDKRLAEAGEGAAPLAGALGGAAVDAGERCLCAAGERFTP